MIRTLLLLATLFVFSVTHAQKTFGSGNSVLQFEAGVNPFRPFALNEYLEQSTTSTSFRQFRTVGLTSSGYVLSRGGELDGALALHFFLPEENIIRPDTLKYRMGGWEFMSSLYGIDLLRTIKVVDFIVAPGVYWGSIRLRKYNSTGNFKANELFKNPFVAPMLRADLRFVFGPIAIGGRFSYRYDITAAKWRKGSSEVFPGYKFREMQYLVYFGLVFNRSGNILIN